MTKTADDYRADAQRNGNVMANLLRNDGDAHLGLSAWSNGLNSDLALARADILDNDGLSEFAGLFDGDRRVQAKLIDGKFGMVWLLTDGEADRYGRRFIPSGRRSRVQKQLRLDERMEEAPAWAAHSGNGTGLSGACSVRVSVYRTDGGYPGAEK